MTDDDNDLALGVVDSNVDFDRTRLFSPLSSLLPPLASPPSSAAAGEPIYKFFNITIIFFLFWWLSCNILALSPRGCKNPNWCKKIPPDDIDLAEKIPPIRMSTTSCILSVI